MGSVVHIPVADLMFTSKCNLRCKYCFEEKKKTINLKLDDFRKFLEEGGTLKFFLFGGEPLMNPKFLEEFMEWINSDNDLPEHVRKEMQRSSKNLITNGTLIHKYVDLLKKNDHHLQISIDGIKEAHDANRIYKDGSGSWDRIVENIVEVCVKEGLDWSMHGVMNRHTIKYLFENTKFMFELYLKYQGKKKAHQYLSKNIYQIIFEEDWTDEDIDVLLEQIDKTAEYLWNHPKLTPHMRRECLFSFFTRKGGTCGAGWSLFAVDSNLDIFPCHRQADNSDFDLDIYKLGNIYEPENLKNFTIYNNFFNVSKTGGFIYGNQYLNQRFSNGSFYWHNWCPSTNAYASGIYNPYYVNSKYVKIFQEVDLFIHHLMKHYGVEKKDGNTRQPNRRQ